MFDEVTTRIINSMSDVELAKYRRIGGRLPRTLEHRALGWEMRHASDPWLFDGSSSGAAAADSPAVNAPSPQKEVAA